MVYYILYRKHELYDAIKLAYKMRKGSTSTTFRDLGWHNRQHIVLPTHHNYNYERTSDYTHEARGSISCHLSFKVCVNFRVTAVFHFNKMRMPRVPGI